MKVFGAISMLVTGALIGGFNKYAVNDLGFWLTAIPLSMYVGGLHAVIFWKE